MLDWAMTLKALREIENGLVNTRSYWYDLVAFAPDEVIRAWAENKLVKTLEDLRYISGLILSILQKRKGSI